MAFFWPLTRFGSDQGLKQTPRSIWRLLTALCALGTPAERSCTVVAQNSADRPVHRRHTRLKQWKTKMHFDTVNWMGILFFLHCCANLHVPFEKPVLICTFPSLCSFFCLYKVIYCRLSLDYKTADNTLLCLVCLLGLGLFWFVGFFWLEVCCIFLFVFNTQYKRSAFNLCTIYVQTVVEFSISIPFFFCPYLGYGELFYESCNGTLSRSNFINCFLPLALYWLVC